MQDEQLRYSFEDKFKEDLTTYLQGKQLVDNMLPDITDMEDKWLGSKVENLYTYLRDRIDYDHMDDYICEKVLLLSTEEHKDIAAIVGKCAARTNSLLRHLPIAPGSSDAFQAYVAALHQMYYMGAAMQLKRMGYHMTKI